MKKSAFLILFLFTGYSLFAQKKFEGYINYSFEISGENAAALTGLMPKSLEIYSSKKDTYMKVNGGLMAAEVISNAKEAYILKRSEKTYYILANNEKGDDNEKAEKEEEVLTLHGLRCQKYRVTKTTEKGEETSFVWLNNEYVFPQTGGQNDNSMGIKGVPGIALKTTVNSNGLTITLNATEFKLGKQSKKLFSIPKGFKKTEAPGTDG